jgi:drug/metabolite transporter (DMT)-like permease
LSIILNKRIIPERTDGKWKMYLILLLVGNAIIGSFGYYLRYYTIDKIPVSIYGMLSYFGIVMAYVYGVSLNHDKITWQKIVGSLIIIISGFFLTPFNI